VKAVVGAQEYFSGADFAIYFGKCHISLDHFILENFSVENQHTESAYSVMVTEIWRYFIIFVRKKPIIIKRSLARNKYHRMQHRTAKNRKQKIYFGF
jgi:hypothetical protein